MIVITIVIITLIIYIYTLWTWSFTTCEINKIRNYCDYIYIYTYQLYISYKCPFLLATCHCFCHFWWFNSSMFPQKTPRTFGDFGAKLLRRSAECVCSWVRWKPRGVENSDWKVSTAWRLKRLSRQKIWERCRNWGSTSLYFARFVCVKSCFKNYR